VVVWGANIYFSLNTNITSTKKIQESLLVAKHEENLLLA
jgi:hypothetical protein